MNKFLSNSNFQTVIAWSSFLLISFLLHSDVLLYQQPHAPFVDGPAQHLRVKVTVEKDPAIAKSTLQLQPS